MAGAKETPRQKLISLMYLVFITMLALNVSKEVLDGFGQMYEKISDANVRVYESNNALLKNILVNAEEKGGKWVAHKRTAEQIKTESDAFFNSIEALRRSLPVSALSIAKVAFSNSFVTSPKSKATNSSTSFTNTVTWF